MTWIETFSGKRFDLLEPTPEQVDLKDIAHALARINRFTGHTTVPYSVAEHAMHVEWCVREIGNGDPLLNALALHHDDAEAYVGDVSAPMKAALRESAYDGRTWFHSIEDGVQETILKALSLPEPTSEQEAIIKEADLWCLAAERMVLMPNTGEHEWYLKAQAPPELVQRLREPYWRHARVEEIGARFYDAAKSLLAQQ